jgi:2,4-dienoyl-CoA reductase-like NADH-dependent reductase (Old Yellow Enzyme family)
MAVPKTPKFVPPTQPVSTGSADPLEDTTPTLFRPLRIRGKTLRNRICVSPMCQYSCTPFGPRTGVLTPLSVSTYLQYAFRGTALVMSEAVVVQEKARISVNCPGLWNDTQAEAMRALTDLVHSQGGLFGVQRHMQVAKVAHLRRGKLPEWVSQAQWHLQQKGDGRMRFRVHLEEAITPGTGRARTIQAAGSANPTR